ncbi:MAG: radical SAM protein [Chlamydiota bacterium]
MKNRAITLVELPPTSFGRLDGEPVDDVFCYFKLPARAIPLLHAILLREGFTNLVSINPSFNAPPGRLTAADIERIAGSDFLLLSAISRTIPQSRELGLLYKKLNPKGTIIIGGSHATYRPEECLEWADVVVRQEGDNTLPRLMEALLGNGAPDGAGGISYKNGSGIVHEPPVEPLTETELSNLPAPCYDDGTKKGVWVWPLSTSRGCPFKCDFCSVSSLYGSVYRRRSNESIIADLERMKGETVKYIFFNDDNFAGKPEETKQLLRMIIDRRLNRILYLCQLCISAAFDKELMGLMREAGFSIVCVGIESLSEETLKALNKKVDVKRNMMAPRLFREAGMWVHGMMMIGGDGDTERNLAETDRWARRNLDSVQYMTPTPLAGTKFAETMKRSGRVLTEDFSLYDGQHVVLKPNHFTPLRLQHLILDMYREFYSFRESVRTAVKGACTLRMIYPLRKILLYFYVKKLIRSAFRSPQFCAHLGWLRGVSSAIPVSRADECGYPR